MDASRFDALARVAARAGSRRAMLGLAVGTLSAGVLGGRAEARSRLRANGEICRKPGDCASTFCAPKDATGRRRCQCEQPCLLLDGSPGDCTGGVCHCPVCPAPDCVCLANNQGRLGCGIFFVVATALDAGDPADPMASLQRVTAVPAATMAEAVCTVDSDCPPVPDPISCYPFKPFCIGGQACSLFLDCKDDGPLQAC